jgi:hypothetical protein
MSLFEQFATNRKAEVEGVEVTFGSKNPDGTIPTFRIARMGKTNKRYQKMLEAETKPHIHAIRNDTLSADIDEAITLKIFLATVLLGWSGIIEPKIFGSDQAVPYTAENGEKLFKALPELYATLKQQASTMSLFRDSQVEEDSKN